MEDVVIYNLNKFIEYCNGPQNFEYDYDFKQHKEVAGYIETLIKGYRELEENHKKLSENPEWLKHYWIGRKEVDELWKSKIKEKIEPVIDSLEKNGFVGYADELRDIVSELMEDK